MKFVKHHLISISLMTTFVVLLVYSIFVTVKSTDPLGVNSYNVNDSETMDVIGKIVGSSQSDGYDTYEWDDDKSTTVLKHIDSTYMLYIEYEGNTYSVDSKILYMKYSTKENKKIHLKVKHTVYESGKEGIEIVEVGELVKKKKKKKK